jgi:uncharacterized protein
MSAAIDVNLLLYASDAGSPYHERAGRFLADCASHRDLVYLAWPTVMGYLRIATHPSIFEWPLSPEEAAANIAALVSLPHVKLLSEQDDFWDLYRQTADALHPRGNLVPDAHLAALLRQHGVRRLYTTDRDFRRFDFLDVIDPIADDV